MSAKAALSTDTWRTSKTLALEYGCVLLELELELELDLDLDLVAGGMGMETETEMEMEMGREELRNATQRA